MSDQTSPRPLGDADLLAWAVILGYRAQQHRAGLRLLLMPFPPCPTCRSDVHTVNQAVDGYGLNTQTRLTMQPCGHGHTADDEDVHRLSDHIGDMLEALERDDRSHDPNVHGWSISDIIREAQDRVGTGEGKPQREASGPNTRGYCPHCGRGDCAPTADEYEQQRQRAQQLAATLDDVLRHFVHKGHPGEPCLSSGWISEKTVARWRDVAYPTKEQP
ncbi:hypothetical protein ACFW2I_09030 [Streptomyces nigra]|uniref:hypothetical protein n=1 Tax=Streptomyces nigra TaxID=1827580 RepID=UPI0036C0B739